MHAKECIRSFGVSFKVDELGDGFIFQHFDSETVLSSLKLMAELGKREWCVFGIVMADGNVERAQKVIEAVHERRLILLSTSPQVIKSSCKIVLVGAMKIPE